MSYRRKIVAALRGDDPAPRAPSWLIDRIVSEVPEALDDRPLPGFEGEERVATRGWRPARRWGIAAAVAAVLAGGAWWSRVSPPEPAPPAGSAPWPRVASQGPPPELEIPPAPPPEDAPAAPAAGTPPRGAPGPPPVTLNEEIVVTAPSLPITDTSAVAAASFRVVQAAKPLPPGSAAPSLIGDRHGVSGGPARTATTLPFLDAADRPRSAFGLEVSTDSYAAVRHDLEQGRRPERSAVQIEELVNRFDYDDPAPRLEDFTLRVEGAPSPFAVGPRFRLVRVGVRGRESLSGEDAEAPPIAYEVQAQVEMNPEVVERYRLLGYEGREIADAALDSELLDGGELPGGHAVTALYEVELRRPWLPRRSPLATLRLRYRPPGSDAVVELEHALRRQQVAHRWELAPPSLRLAAVVAEFAEILRGDHPATGARLKSLIFETRRLVRDRPNDAAVRELLRLIRLTERLSREEGVAATVERR